MSVDSIQVLDIIRNPLFFNVSLWKDLDFWLCCIGKYALAGKLSNVFILLLCRRAGQCAKSAVLVRCGLLFSNAWSVLVCVQSNLSGFKVLLGV